MKQRPPSPPGFTDDFCARYWLEHSPVDLMVVQALYEALVREGVPVGTIGQVWFGLLFGIAECKVKGKVLQIRFRR